MTAGVPEVSYAVILTRDVAALPAVAIRSIAAQTPASELLLVLNDPRTTSMRVVCAGRSRRTGALGSSHDGNDLGRV